MLRGPLYALTSDTVVRPREVWPVDGVLAANAPGSERLTDPPEMLGHRVNHENSTPCLFELCPLRS